MCSKEGSPLAGLTAGKICFCGATLTEASAPEGACVQTCAGDGEKCGTDGEPPYDSVYTTPTVLNGFKIFQGGEEILHSVHNASFLLDIHLRVSTLSIFFFFTSILSLFIHFLSLLTEWIHVH